MGATLDGNAVNRRLLKLHGHSDLVYKTKNPFSGTVHSWTWRLIVLSPLQYFRWWPRLVLLFRSTSPTKNHTELLVLKKSYIVGTFKLIIWGQETLPCTFTVYSAMVKRSYGATSPTFMLEIQLEAKVFGWSLGWSLSTLLWTVFQRCVWTSLLKYVNHVYSLFKNK